MTWPPAPSIFVLQGSSTWLVNITSFTGGTNEWTNSASQRSRPVLLSAGEVLLLEAVHCQTPSGPSRLQVTLTSAGGRLHCSPRVLST